MMTTSRQAGFSAAELLISLFIAAAFAATGYQLYSAVIQDSGDSGFRASASNIAYNALRQYAPQAKNPCASVNESPTATIPPSSSLPPPTAIAVDFSCPYGLGSSIAKITATVTYGSPQEKVVHALYVSN